MGKWMRLGNARLHLGFVTCSAFVVDESPRSENLGPSLVQPRSNEVIFGSQQNKSSSVRSRAHRFLSFSPRKLSLEESQGT